MHRRNCYYLPPLRPLILALAHQIEEATGVIDSARLMTALLRVPGISMALRNAELMSGPAYARWCRRHLRRTCGDVLRSVRLTLVNDEGKVVAVKGYLAHRRANKTVWVPFFSNVHEEYQAVMATNEKLIKGIEANLRPVEIAVQLTLGLADDEPGEAVRDDIRRAL